MNAVAKPRAYAQIPTTASARDMEKYRPEIDGLRAFAVVAVIINHFNKDLLPSGYLGVDIFFVISGYVITSSFENHEYENFKDFIISFYERRIKRLIPALAVFVLITSILICLFNPDPETALETGKSSILGLSNLYLFQHSTDYFAQSAVLNPFTHTWSLGVEEQFYLLFPLLIWFSGFGKKTRNGPRNLFILLVPLTFASLIGFVYLYQANQPAAYFLMPSRFWEMATGCLIFLGFRQQERSIKLLEKVPPLLVIAAIVFVLFLPVASAVAATILTVALSAILIGSIKKGGAVYKFFTIEKVIYVGLISYSLYLWHWAVLSISRWTIGVHWWSVPFQLALILILAIASYQKIEKPLRKNPWGKHKWQELACGAGLITVSLFIQQLIVGPHTKLFYLGTISQEKNDVPKGCEDINENGPGSGFRLCQINHGAQERTIWIIGDSHAGKLRVGAEHSFNRTQVRVVIYSTGGTPFPPVGRYGKGNKVADLQKLDKYHYLLKQLPYQVRKNDLVVIGIRHPYYFGGTYYGTFGKDFVFLSKSGTPINQRDYFSEWLSDVDQLAEKLKSREVKILVMTPTPEWKDAVEKKCFGQGEEWFSRFRGKNCSLPKEFFVGRNGLYVHILNGLKKVAESNSNVIFYDAFGRLCPAKYCQFAINGRPLYKDDNHLSSYASKILMEDIKKALW